MAAPDFIFAPQGWVRDKAGTGLVHVSDLFTPTISNSTDLSAWTITGTVAAPVAPNEGTSFVPAGVTNIIELDPDEAIARSITLTADPEFQRDLQVRVMARTWMDIHAANTALSEVTADTWDFSSLEITLSKTDSTLPAPSSDIVPLHWATLETAFTLPIGTTTHLLTVTNTGTKRVQLAKVSARLA